MTSLPTFADSGPFDDDERALIDDVLAVLSRTAGDQAAVLRELVLQNVDRLTRLGQVVGEYPSLFGEQSLGRRRRDLSTLVERLSHSDLSNFAVCLPTRALLNRDLAMAEVNFYRLLHHVCDEALEPVQAAPLRFRVDHFLCLCLYGRLADEVLTHIASDGTVGPGQREKAVVALTEIWDDVSYRVHDFFPVLEATWEARRIVPVTLGTLMGTSEMFRLIASGCDPEFVDYLVRPGRSEDEAAAFREFLFGSTTEQLQRLELRLQASGKSCLDPDELPKSVRVARFGTHDGEPAPALYEFFLSRHLQAAARRLGELAGPKRTAEEYVMLHYLEEQPAPTLRTTIPPAAR